MSILEGALHSNITSSFNLDFCPLLNLASHRLSAQVYPEFL